MTTLSTAEIEAVRRHLKNAGLDLASPLQHELIAGGKSNVTIKLSCEERTWVLRMPPSLGRTPSAHDIGREVQITRALAAAGFPVATPILYIDDDPVVGVPFAVSEFIDGACLRSRAQLGRLDDDELVQMSNSLVETLSILHHLDVATLGLSHLGRSTDFSGRQLGRWAAQWKIVGSEDLADLAASVHARLSRHLPGHYTSSLIHGDFRVDNVLLDMSGAPRVQAVVDWELSTQGDPVGDVAMMCAYRMPEFDLVAGLPAAWASTRLPSAGEIAEAYQASGGVDLRHWDFHLALAHYKIAVIAAGIAYRAHRNDAATERQPSSAADAVEPFLNYAASAAGVLR